MNPLTKEVYLERYHKAYNAYVTPVVTTPKPQVADEAEWPLDDWGTLHATEAAEKGVF